jgi:ABC-type transporter Mla subunit MlaD
MAPRLTWSRLVPGIVTITVLATATVVVLMYSSVGRVTGDKVRLYVATNSAHGVMRGTEVWLSGQKVGVVEDVGFRPVSADTASRVIIALDVRERDAQQIRRDSDIRVRAGANLVGPIVVYISAGTPESSPARNGDTLFAARQSDMKDAMTRLGDAAKELGPLMTDARAIMAHARNPNGTLGAFMRSGRRLGGEMNEMRSQVNGLREQFGASNAPRARFISSAQVAFARVDSIRLLLRSEQNSLGRFRRDSTLRRTLASVREELGQLRARMTDDRGTLGRFAGDSAIQRALAGAETELSLLIEDVRKRPLRYIAF